MAKSAPLKIKTKVKAEDSSDDPVVEEVVETDSSQETAVETETFEDEKEQLLADKVPFSCFEELRPAPTIGIVSLVRDMGMPSLPKGVTSIPRVVAEVLADKKLGQIVKL